MSVHKKENTDICSNPVFKKVVDHYIYSTGLNPDKFSLMLEKKIKALIYKEETLTVFLNYIESSFSKQSFFKVLDDNNKIADLLFLIFENSRFLSEILNREPNLLFWVLDKNVLEIEKSAADFNNELLSSISTFSASDKKINAVKRYYRHNILRIGIRDLFLNAGLEPITTELSGLADSIIRIVTDIAIRDLKFKYGKNPKTDFMILGLGKLGGSELNYSSDIDLIFAFRDDGEFKSAEKRNISYYDYYQELGKNIIKLLTEITTEGYLYRVDTRLRPEGNSGPLTPSYAYLLSYYESRGEIWERQMLIKARVIYDQNNFGEDFLKNISSFIYPKYPLKNPLDEIAKIKFRIETGNDKANNIKLCKGGVRDIEFSVQALQLLNGGKLKSVREKNTLSAVKCLSDNGLLSLKEAMVLKNAYVFYRNIEHRLQIKNYHQTFTLPDESIELLRLAKSLGLKNNVLFRKKLNSHLEEIRKIFKKVFKIDVKETFADIERLLGGSEHKIQEILGLYGITDMSTLRFIRMIVYGSKDESEKKYPASLSTLAKEVLSLVFNSINEYPDKTQMLKNLEYLISGRIDIESFLRLLHNEKYLNIILTVCGYSNSFTRIISEQEKLLELIYNFGLNELPMEIHASLPLDLQKNISLIQSAGNNIDGKLKDGDFYLNISNYTDTILKNVINELKFPELNKIKFALFALGKLGSMEMGINSDADLFFVYDADDEKGTKNATNFFEKLVLALNSKTGAFFELDLRLRPEGKNAPIAISKSSFAEYLKNRASFWERLALTRVRPVCGEALLIKEIVIEIRSFVYAPLTKSDLNEVLEMRKSIEKKSYKLDKNSIDIKTMEGGLVDIEFLVQVMKMLFRSKYPVLEKKNTPNVLLFLKNKAIFPATNIKYLVDTYYFFRNIEKYIALNNLSERYILKKNDERNIYKLIGFSNSVELFEITMQKMKNVRRIYQQMFKKFERLL